MPAVPEESPQLTRQQLAQARVIARGRKIKDLNRLLAEYGGTARHWVKKSSQPFLIDNRLVEVHWYEHQGIGRVEAKIKWLD